MFQFRSKLHGLMKELTQSVSNRYLHVERKVKVNDLDINIVEGGKGEKSVLLMPGALGSSWTDFKPQIEELPKLLPNYTVISWDPPGYGKSIPPKRKWGLDFFQNDARCAVELMKALKRPKFSIIGWSDGGITGLIAAGRYVDNIEKLIIWGAGAYLIPDEVIALHKMKDVNKWSPRMREPMEKVYGEKRFAELWSEWVDAASAFYGEREGDFCKQEVEMIKAPTLILHGKKDPMIAAEHIPYLREHIKGARYHEFPEGKHNIHLRYAEEFNKLVAQFLSEN
ncbi:valacyclovir hydrolase [Stomoxys calcitrans]|uniref:valacyclovir hydrolase n=1 Tax=Stomoxys calcitrans TaxID=35570 RepID=UPI0027E26BE2|nr:valacyclovir hydrolase [Stomoxys calcitrans]